MTRAYDPSLLPGRLQPDSTPDTCGSDGKAAWDAADYARFTTWIYWKTGIDLNQYKYRQMHRRLVSMAERANTHSFAEYNLRLKQDAAEYTAFLNRLTIHVSELFRNPEKWEEMRRVILPSRLERKSALKVWSAGCSYGAEPYSLAILLDQIAPGAAHRIYATDVDRSVLERAREGRFTAADVRNLDPVTLAHYFLRDPAGPNAAESAPCYQAKAALRDKVTFRAHNLLADPCDGGYDLICCRNVVIYFTEEAKRALFERLSHALAPGGYLFVGGTERIFDFRKLEFDSPLPFFYRRIDLRR